MQLDAALMAIQQRTVGGCIDMGIIFLREHFAAVMKMTMCLAIPFCAVTWWLVSRHDWSAVGIMVLFGFTSPFLGAALVGEAGLRVFGDQFSVGRGFWSVLTTLFPLGALLLLARGLAMIGGLMCVAPGYLVSARYGFLSEIFLLERQRLKKYEGRLNDLTGAMYGSILYRQSSVLLFYSMCVASLFVLVDLTTTFLLGWPVFIARVSLLSSNVTTSHLWHELGQLLTKDELVLTTLMAIMWFVYPVARLAWFFCYLDIRIRQEGWDLELEFRIEANRLEAATT